MADVLVTGGAGFIGSHLVDALLEDGNDVRVLDDLSTGKRANLDERAELMEGSITDADTVCQAMNGIDAVFHLAAVASVQKSNEDWANTHCVNQTGSINIFDAARARKLPVVYASSAAVYGNTDHIPTPEDAPLIPMTAYGADKLGSELHARVAGIVHDVPTAGLRFFNVYGPRQDPSSPYSGVISIFARRIARAMPITIYGDGLATRDFVYVGDIVAHLRAAMDKASTDAPVWNVCTGFEVTIAEIAETLMEITGNRVDIVHEPERRGDIRRSLGDPSKVSAAFGIVAKTQLEYGLRKVIDE
ncbi:MAG: NAD-dependent epimerase/dehydratase family protein [Pseudomonadota bacterium]|nr:NAD-dependent epimerase/dehydratase family protein [Pseudomonadota bacterium]